MTHAAEFMVIFATLFLVYQLGLRNLRCGYCGAITDHEDDCPYGGSGMRM